MSILKEHLNPTPNTIAERFYFYKRDRRTGESIHEYVAELRKMSEHCSFGETLNDYSRDHFVCGLEKRGMFKLGEKGREGGRREFFRCGSPTHLANKCPFANL